MAEDLLKENEVEIGIDEEGNLYFDAGRSAALGFLMRLLSEGAEGILKHEQENGLELVKANNKASHPVLKPLINCPKMVYKEACEACFWHDSDRDVCRGG